MLTQHEIQEIRSNLELQVRIHQFPETYLDSEIQRAAKLIEEMSVFLAHALVVQRKILTRSGSDTSSRSGYRSLRLVDLDQVANFAIEMDTGMTPMMKLGPYRICLCEECCPPGPL